MSYKDILYNMQHITSILYNNCKWSTWASQVAQLVKNPPADAEDTSLIPGLGRSPGEGNRNPLQYSRLRNPMD